MEMSKETLERFIEEINNNSNITTINVYYSSFDRGKVYDVLCKGRYSPYFKYNIKGILNYYTYHTKVKTC